MLRLVLLNSQRASGQRLGSLQLAVHLHAGAAPRRFLQAISGVYQRVLGPYIDALRVSKGLFEAGGKNELDQGWGVQSCFLFSIFQPSVCILFIIIVVVLQLFWLGFLLSYLLLLLVAVISSAIRCIGGTGAWRNFPRTHGFGSWKMT